MRTIVLLSFILLVACESEDNSFDFNLDKGTSVERLEIALPSRSIFIDSLRTDNENNLIVGNYDHPELGDLSASSYSSLTFIEGRLPNDTLTFDSLKINLYVDSYKSSDDSGELQILVSQYEGEIQSSIVYLKGESLSLTRSYDTLMHTLSGDNIQKISINAPILGQRLFREMNSDNPEVSSGYTTKIALSPVVGNQTAISFDKRVDSTEFVLYTSYDTLVFETKLVFGTNSFSNVDIDRSASQLNSIADRSLFDSPSGQQAISPLFGVFTYLDLEEVIAFITSSDRILINNAVISTATPTRRSFVSEELRYYFYDETYGFRGEGILTRPLGTIIISNDWYTTRTPEIQLGSFNSDSSEYNADVTFFVESLYNIYQQDSTLITEGLVLTPNRFLSLRESSLSPNANKLVIYYTKIN
jgi:hypothetical protein